jgi:group I intron endonuclease
MAKLMSNFGIIYKITNKITNKVYIGQTRFSVDKRFKEHCKSDNKTYIKSTISKYGKDAFVIEELASSLSYSYLDELEKYFIGIYNSLAPNGYNLTNGGGRPKIQANGKTINLGTFTTEKEAYDAYLLYKQNLLENRGYCYSKAS